MEHDFSERDNVSVEEKCNFFPSLLFALKITKEDKCLTLVHKRRTVRP